ncbi:Protein kinase domain,Protein kinase-like domain,Serine/threonine-protein kinase Bud32 [Cinara cedri]|uniref:non-specific serine/threonine protein kinase n=1 Tax=Cinara cedri TaxID=506608 RepID=A0A5E4MHH6_9HEMI|nr:Protein kinase domain,Protein kinase-like domain,Serine/threonine-protein kinase Bud32 [Cinara cedri]
MELYKQGAESKIYISFYSDRKVIVKERFSKLYRNQLLDQSIRRERTKAEAKAILKCKQGGIATPVIYLLDLNNCKITMEFINSQTVNDFLNNLKNDKQYNDVELTKLLMEIGAVIGKMHSLGIFHGDLTTSNILRKEDGTLVLIDFGLSHFNPSNEDKAVDLYVLERAFISTHSYFSDLFASIIDGYKHAYGLNVQSIINQFQIVRARGRKRLMFG